MPLQFVERSHQRLGDIASAVDAEASGEIRAGRVERASATTGKWIFAVAISVFLFCLPDRLYKGANFFRVLFPGLASTPDATSTPQGFRIRIASATLPGSGRRPRQAFKSVRCIAFSTGSNRSPNQMLFPCHPAVVRAGVKKNGNQPAGLTASNIQSQSETSKLFVGLTAAEQKYLGAPRDLHQITI